MKRAYMDRFIDTIEWIAAGFVGLVAANIFVAVLLRNLFSYSIPDSFDIGRLMLGILNARGLVVIRTTALNTNGDNPNRASLDTTAAIHRRHTACCGNSFRNA